MMKVLAGWLHRVKCYTPQPVWRLIVGVVGTTVLLLGIALLVLPGPAFLVIPVGLGILASEFLWARRLLRKTKRLIKNGAKKVAPAFSQRGSEQKDRPSKDACGSPASKESDSRQETSTP